MNTLTTTAAKHRKKHLVISHMHNRPRPLTARSGCWELVWVFCGVAAGVLAVWFILHGGNTRADEPPVVDDPLATALGVECRQQPSGDWWLTGPNPLPCGPSTLPPVTPGHVDPVTGCTPAVPSFNCPPAQPAAADAAEWCESCGTDTTEPTETTWPDTTSVTEAPTPTEPPGTTSTSPATTSTPPASTLPTSSTSSTTTTSSSSPSTSTTSTTAATTSAPFAPSSSTASVAPPPTVAPAQQLPTTGPDGTVMAAAFAACVAGAVLAAVARRRPGGAR